MLKIAIVDDVEMTRIGLSFLLNKFKDFELVGEASNGRMFLNLLATVKPDLVLMDVNMPIMNGIDATRESIKKYPDLKIIALTNDDAEASIEDMIAAGAKGFLMKKVDSNELNKAIEIVVNGGTYFSPELISFYNRTGISTTSKSSINLNAQEDKVLHLLCKGLSLKEISEKIALPFSTVETICTTLSVKTNTRNAVGLVLFAIKNKLVII